MRFFVIVTGLLAVMLCVTEAEAQTWTRFRGPNGSGVSQATTVPVKWTEEDYNWKIDLPGQGNSSAVAWQDRLFITCADIEAGKRYLLCLDTSDGSTRWRQEFDFEKYRKHRNNSFATSTPTVDAQRVYVLWQSKAKSELVALDHDGKTLWRFDMGRYKSGHGGGRSPILYRDTVIVGNDNDGESFLVAVDIASGKQRWRVERTGDRACYSTPCIYEVAGRRPEIIFTHSYRGITGIDAATGQKHWEIDVFGTHAQRAVGSPVLYGDLVIGSSGFTTAEKNIVAVRPTDKPGGATVKEVYRLSRQVPHVPTPLVYRDWLFLWTDTGIVSCFEAGSGKKIWQKRVGGTYYGSPICVDGHLYAIDADGVVIVLSASDQFAELGRHPLGEPAHSTPSVSEGRMYLRTRSHLFSIGGAK